MSIRAVLLDLFDTLIYLGPTHAHAREEAIRVAQEAGISEERWMSAWRATADAALRGEMRTLEERVRGALAAAGIGEPAEGLVSTLTRARRSQAEHPRLYDDVEASLTALRERGYRLALVGNVFSYERDVVHRVGLPRLLDAVILSCAMGVCKPEPKIYLTAAASLSVRPTECVFLGDGMNQELSGARAACMLAVRIDRTVRDQHEERDEAYDARVGSLTELVTWLASSDATERRGAGA